jgi:hypothetical protein
MTVEKKNLTKADLQVIWGEVFTKGMQAKQALDILNLIQFQRLRNSEPLPAIALGSVLAALKTIATLAKGSGDATTLHAIADALEASAALPTNEEISGSRQQSFFVFTPALQKMYDELVAFCRN